MNWLLRSLLVIARRTRRQALSKSGFVLPTVVMVSLVVILLTTAILVQAFDRAEKASKFRIEQAVLSAATPALERARAKLDALFTDTTLPRTTPSDLTLYNALSSSRYTLGDETRLKLVYDINQNGTIQGNTATLEDNETLTTAWKFPVDTDNNGKFDSYSLYGIYFRSPSRNNNGAFDRARNSLEARIPPMSGSTLNTQCKNVTGTSTSLVGDSWYQSGAKLTKSFFVYTATVGITNTNPSTGYETFKGNKGFYALELQQDRMRIPLSNNAVMFQDDLELTPGATWRLNGRISTNANLLIGGHSGAAIKLYQVSSAYSCFYEEENSKITVAGNVGTGDVTNNLDQTAVTVDLFNGIGNTPGTATINNNNRSTTHPGGNQVAYNDAAYNKRIALMKQTALSYSTLNPPTELSVFSITQYPLEVKNGFKAKINAPAGSSLNTQDVLAEQIEIYLKNRTRRVPYAEVAAVDGTDALGTYDTDGNGIDTNVFTSGIDPPAAWSEITNTNPLTLNTANPTQTQPEQQRKNGKETYLGDRVSVGNNLPLYWKDGNGQYVTGTGEKKFLGSNINWTSPNTEPRYRTTQVAPLPDVRISDRNDFWEDAAAQQPSGTSPNVGGLRVITGAGIYVTDDRSASFLPQPTLDAAVSPPPLFTTSSITTENDNIIVWPDTMPMTGGAGETRKGDLQMRATAVYHYKDSSTTTGYINRTPTACVSSYYDPTNGTTAKNSSNTWLASYDANGRSNNGIVYPAPYTTDSDRVTAVSTYRVQLNKQARLVFPNGRIVNQLLRDALKKIDAGGTRSLVDNSAIDTAICAIRIIGDTTFLPSTTGIIPHGAIKEASFLDAREVKAIEGSDSDPANYDLDLEQRQPLEIRVTDIDLRTLADKAIGGTTQQEYLLPNSGIIYASRDDALLDLSDTSAEKELLSPTDFRLDPTRRPNGIRLINGSNLARVITYREEEKGLIFVSNLPVYIKADSNNGFNLHSKPGTNTIIEEFTNSLDSDWSNFYTRGSTLASNPDNNFACRSGQLGCATGNHAGDQWRSATIIADAITLLSNSFTDGFRNQGDYDLNNNAGSSATEARKRNGFWDNSFVPSAAWWDIYNTDNAYPDETATTKYVGSYLTNGVTPVQRRANFSEYLMEVCPKIPVETCGPDDWYINPDSSAPIRKVSDLSTDGTQELDANIHKAGTTAKLAHPNYQRYARRVAFWRNANNRLLNASNELITSTSSDRRPVPLGIVGTGTGKVQRFAYGSGMGPRVVNNALWFKTTDATTPTKGNTYNASNPLFINEMPTDPTGQPSLVPVLQIHSPEGTPPNDNSFPTNGSLENEWLQKVASDTTINAVLVSGNSPSRTAEEPAGLHNFVRLLEKWDGTLSVKGSFIQFKRSTYATGPFATVLRDTALATATLASNLSLFDYPNNIYKVNNGTPTGTLPYYKGATEQWSFDVGLLSRSADLFAQKFTSQQLVAPPSEYFRQVERDDSWIQTLLCAAQGTGNSYTYAIDASEQPSTGCPSLDSYQDH